MKRGLVKLLTFSTVLLLLVQVLLTGFSVLTRKPKQQSPLPPGSPLSSGSAFPPGSPLPPGTWDVLSPSTYSYVLNQPGVCQDGRPLLVAMVPVVPGDRTSRDVIRKTWGSVLRGSDLRTVFFVGLSPDAGVQDDLAAESREHGDVIQMDFVDSYRNLTVKTLMMMNWVSAFCRDASFSMKVDADVFVNVFHLVELLRGYPTRGFITGSLIRDGRPRRDRSSKWYISEDEYPDPYFPPYVSGAGYVFSTDVAEKICLASRRVPAVPLEDVYVGLCLRAAGVSPVYAQSFLALRNLFEVRHLEFDTCTFSTRVIVNGFKPAELLRIWQEFTRNYLDC